MNMALGKADRERLGLMMRQRCDALHARLLATTGGNRAEHAREVLLQDGDDAPQRSADREIDFAMTDLETAELAALDAAMQRLADGRYGCCQDCGADIPLARLEIEPAAPLCVACQGVREKGRTPVASL